MYGSLKEVGMKKDFIIISVESRKGGVGKTTAALNLARILLEKRHAVLFLDVDITGTNATDCIDSPFWKDSCYAVRNAAKGKTDVANLLAIFERQFMPGLGIPRFVKESVRKGRKDHHALAFAPDKINVIGSQIYDLNASPANENTDTCICKPSILFDELHAFWFIEFLQKTCEAFLDVIRNDQPDRAVAVVVDNSPGYVGIAPAVQEWLTDLGPDRGKFLTVSSLDKQDLLSCGHAIHNIHQLYERKWRASRKFADATNHERESGEELQLSRDEENFFLRLVEALPPRHVSNETSVPTSGVNVADLSFYRVDNAEVGGAFLNQAEGYQGLLINRVPRLVKRGVYAYDTEKMYSFLHHKGSNLVQCLLGDNTRKYTDWMVSYDEYIEYQFLQPMISRRVGRMSRRKGRFEEFMHVIEERHSIPPDELLQDMLHEGARFHPEMLDEVRMYLRKISENVTGVIRLVERSGYSYLTSLIHEEWLPGNILRDFSVAMQNAFLEMEGPFIEFAPWELGEDQSSEETWMFIKELRHYIERHMKERDMSVPIERSDQFVSSLIVVMALSIGPRWWHPKRGPEFPEVIASVANIEAMRWARRRGRSRERLGIQRFLASESLREVEHEEFFRELEIHPRWLERGLLSRLYRACAAAQARVLDVRRDAEFLIALIQRLVIEDIREAPVLPYIRDVAEKVIVRKTISHESGHQQIAKGFSSAQYMEEFSEVLEKVIRRWETRQ